MAARASRTRRKQGQETAPAAAAPHAKSALRENFESVIAAVLFALFVRGFIAQPYKIPSGSMEETLLVGDHLVVDKILPTSPEKPDPAFLPVRSIRRGDVLIFRPPHQPDTDYIKRVIGLPGEVLTLTYSPERRGVRVLVDGKPLPESYRTTVQGPVTVEPGSRWTLNSTGEPAELRRDWRSRTVPLGPDEYFMMGDNRNDSQDSRYWGPIRAEAVRGRALFVYWSYEAREEEPRGLLARIGYYGRIALHFFSKSRWDRTFQGMH